jgi:hypothetical protein
VILPFLEDAAEALGSMYKGVHCGTFGEIKAKLIKNNLYICKKYFLQ